jgi:hypothetical protein
MPKVGLDRSKTGRAKGTPNKVNAELKDMILGALEDAGGQEYLRQRALDTPGPFLTLVGKILPKNIDANIQGDVRITSITRTIVDAAGNTDS